MSELSSGDVSSPETSDVSTSEVSGDSNASSVEVNEARDDDVSESEMDNDLSNELDESYSSYLENGEKVDNDEASEKFSDEVEEENSGDNLDSDLDSTYDEYMSEKGEAFEYSNDDVYGEEIAETSDAPPNDEDDLDSELDDKYNEYISEAKGENKPEADRPEESDNAEKQVEHIQCRNENLEGKEHSETGVPFERRQVEVDGKQYDVVVPQFESKYDAQLPEDKLKSTDREQFKECNAQLKEEVANNKDLRAQFDDEQIEQIENGDTPDGYTWHHDADVGKMQLVDTETHQKTGHTGGRSIWGGGTENR